MIKRISIFVLLLIFSASLVSARSKKVDKLYAVFDTSMGKIVCELFPKQAPKTVENFVSLAKGEKPWQDPKSKEIEKKPLYNGTIFHRVIPDFMIQGGDPLGLGIGGPGYKFEDEIDASLGFDKVGRLAMANSGPNPNGSQFFITVAETPWLTGHHTIFGQVVEGQDVINAISTTPRDERDRPVKPVVLKTVIITTQKP